MPPSVLQPTGALQEGLGLLREEKAPAELPAAESLAATVAVGKCLNEKEKERVDSTDEEAETVIVFDWDDTLFPSSWLEGKGWEACQGNVSLDVEDKRQLASFEELVLELLQSAHHLGRVMIVTDAEEGWVELSCSIFMPKVRALLQTAGIAIVSARTRFQRYYPKKVLQWKREAFMSHVYSAYASFPSNIVSIGDGPSEREALFSLVYSVPGLVGKCIKLISQPQLWELHYQLETVLRCLETVCHSSEGLDLQLAKENAGKC